MTDIETLVAFVLRARRIEAHSLLRNLERFSAWASGAMRLEVMQNRADATIRSARVHFDLPDEEIFESLASRVRPMLLEKEPIYYGRVLDIIEPHIVDPKGREAVAAIRNRWERASQRTDMLGYTLNDTPTPPSPSLGYTATSYTPTTYGNGCQGYQSTTGTAPPS